MGRKETALYKNYYPKILMEEKIWGMQLNGG
jgi:hypothetical protein